MPTIVLTEQDIEVYQTAEGVRNGSISEKDAERFFVQECGYSRDYARELIRRLRG